MAGAASMWGLMAPLAKDAMQNGLGGLSMVGIRVAGGCLCFWLAGIVYGAMLKRKAQVEHSEQQRQTKQQTKASDSEEQLQTGLQTKASDSERQPQTGIDYQLDRLTRKELLWLLAAGLFAIVLNQCNYIVGLSITSPLNASIMTTTMPILTMILAALVLKEPLTIKKMAGVAIGCLGALTLILATAGGSIGGVLLGDLMCIAGQLSYAIYLTVFKRVISRHHPITCQKWMMTSALVVISPLVIPALCQVEWANLSGITIAETAFVVVGGTFMSFLLSTIAQQILRPTVIAMYNYMQPIVACTVSVLLGLGRFTIYHLLAALLVFLGVYLVNASKART